MIEAKTKATATLAAAVGQLDFTQGNEEIDRLKAQIEHVARKDGETRAEAARLSNEATNFSGPAPDAVAAAILEGVELSEAVKGPASREQLESQRDGLLAALEPLRQRADALRHQLRELEGQERARAFSAFQDHVAELAARQHRAAREIVECHAALQAVADTCAQPYLPEMRKSRAAMAGLMGPEHLIGWQLDIPVPAETRDALALLAGKSRALRGTPVAISTRDL
ncbi:MAG: hypothetical protein K2Q29_11860 [Sphingomonadales bacterium]|nr:hypothetical protein [Sphingomonadales bacterium]